MGLLRRFLRHEGGNYAMLVGITIIPLIAAAGLAADYARYVAASSHLQQLADAASLTLASDQLMSSDDALEKAGNIISANNWTDGVQNVTIRKVDSTESYVDVTVAGNIPATFMGVLGYDLLPVSTSARAERATKGAVEMSLILDNTYSMKDTDAKGVTKLDALKTAAKLLVNELMTGSNGAVRISVVPYADYVNVGTKHRNASWLDVPADYTVKAPEPAPCYWREETTTTKCLERPTGCTTTIDGVTVPATCPCAKEEKQTRRLETPEYICPKPGADKHYKWWGCVGSRKTGNVRLDDGSPSVRYPGYVETSQKCPNPIMPLSTDKAELLGALDGMVYEKGSYKPYTYIPAGLIWGLNTLSPTAPFEDGAAYDAANQNPRKVAVLMTDGENTLKFRASDGRHVGFNSDSEKAKNDRKQTDDDTRQICRNMKAKGVEIYSVAFMVDDALAKEVLEDCATDAQHYFDASDADKLIAAFGTISRSLQVVRLAR